MLEVQTEINPCPTRVPPNNNYKLKSTHVQPVDWVGSRGSPKRPVAIFLRWKEYLSCQTRPHRSPLTLATIKITTKTHEKLCAPGPLSLEIDTTRDYGRQRSPLAPAPTRPPGALHRVVASAPRPLVTRNSLASWLLPVLRQPSRQRLLAHAIIAYSRCCGCTPRTQGPYGPPE
jgi:hypothetical protein